jgi:hypothetical protein
MNWIDKVAAIIRHNLKCSPASEAVKTQIVAEAIEQFVNPPAPEETKKPDEPITSRGESLAALRLRARRWGEWEPWNT